MLKRIILLDNDLEQSAKWLNDSDIRFLPVLLTNYLCSRVGYYNRCVKEMNKFRRCLSTQIRHIPSKLTYLCEVAYSCSNYTQIKQNLFFLKYLEEILKEYKHRFGREHPFSSLIPLIKDSPILKVVIPDNGQEVLEIKYKKNFKKFLTKQVPEVSQHTGIRAHKEYYKNLKNLKSSRNFKYTKREEPEWLGE